MDESTLRKRIASLGWDMLHIQDEQMKKKRQARLEAWQRQLMTLQQQSCRKRG